MKQSFIYSDTLIIGVVLTLKDGTKQYQEIISPIVYRIAEENNKNK